MRRSKFSLSNYKLFSCDMGELIPCGLMEVLPGDSIQQSTQALIRASPLLSPVMHPVHVSIRHFFVPFRLIWDDFEKFITGGADGNDNTLYPRVTLAAGASAVGEVADYLGVPPKTGGGRLVSALPFRAYQLIWSEFYRDQDLIAEPIISKDSGPDTTTYIGLRRVSWEKDYFTSARPWEQKGPAITIPLGNRADVKGIGIAGSPPNLGTNITARETGGTSATYANAVRGTGTAGNDIYLRGTTSSGATTYPDIYADLTNASAVTVNVLRQALALQRFEEARARFGSRYTEYLRYLGVRSSDARLQRPEYLGGGRQTIQFSEVLATAEGTNTDVGDLKGHGIAAMRSNRYRRFFEEHGYVMSLMHVRPKTIYMQGLSRLWNRYVKEDIWQKELEHVGQQKVLNKEIYADHTNQEGVFGYQDRYDEYRRVESSVAGEFRTSTLNHWHFAREFSSDPALNQTFVQCSPTERPFAVSSEDVLYVMAHHSIQARRLVAPQGNSFIF